MNFIPLTCRVLIKPGEAIEVTPGGIYLPDAAQEKPMKGIVIAVADDLKSRIQVNDEVVYGYSGTEIKMDEGDCLLMHENEVYGILN